MNHLQLKSLHTYKNFATHWPSLLVSLLETIWRRFLMSLMMTSQHSLMPLFSSFTIGSFSFLYSFFFFCSSYSSSFHSSPLSFSYYSYSLLSLASSQQAPSSLALLMCCISTPQSQLVIIGLIWSYLHSLVLYLEVFIALVGISSFLFILNKPSGEPHF